MNTVIYSIWQRDKGLWSMVYADDYHISWETPMEGKLLWSTVSARSSVKEGNGAKTFPAIATGSMIGQNFTFVA